MKKQHAYNVCDMMECLLEDDCIIPACVEWVYLGSYFCDLYFCRTPRSVWKKCFDKVKELGKRIVLVIPTPSQKQLAPLKLLVNKLISEFSEEIDEMVLNDYAMLAFAEQHFPNIKRWEGRMLSKETRDPRYSPNEQSAKQFERAIHNDLFGFSVMGVEADPVAPINVVETGECMLALHTPYAYVSMGRICEFGSIGMQLVDKFRLDHTCGRQCIQNWLLYENHGCKFVKYGRAIFTPNEDVVARCSQGNFRIIHSALDYRLA